MSSSENFLDCARRTNRSLEHRSEQPRHLPAGPGPGRAMKPGPPSESGVGASPISALTAFAKAASRGVARDRRREDCGDRRAHAGGSLVRRAYWSLRSMVCATSLAPSAIRSIWQAIGLQPHRFQLTALELDEADALASTCCMARDSPPRPLHHAGMSGEPVFDSAMAPRRPEAGLSRTQEEGQRAGAVAGAAFRLIVIRRPPRLRLRRS